MKVVKPLRPSVLYRSCHRQGQHQSGCLHFGVSRRGGFPASAPQANSERRQLARKELLLTGGVLDRIIPKTNFNQQKRHFRIDHAHYGQSAKAIAACALK